jgi:hypothetical protein
MIVPGAQYTTHTPLRSTVPGPHSLPQPQPGTTVAPSTARAAPTTMARRTKRRRSIPTAADELDIADLLPA